MSNANYMQTLPGGHCFTCHKDYEEESNYHPCFSTGFVASTPCDEACKDSKYPMPLWAKDGPLSPE